MTKQIGLLLIAPLFILLLCVSVAECQSAEPESVEKIFQKFEEVPTIEGSMPLTVPQTDDLDEKAYRTNILLIKLKYMLAIVLVVSWVFSIIIVMRRFGAHSGVDPVPVITSIGLLSVIHGTIIIMLMAHTDQQLSAPIGIMGAIAGYLFGRGTAKSQRDG